MNNDWNTADSIEAAVRERNEKLHFQKRYYDSLHFVDLYPVNVDEYYEGLKDRSRFKQPKDTSRKDAEKDSGISSFLKFKAWFSETSKSELDKKKANAVVLQKEYSELSAKIVNLQRKKFY